MNIYAKVLKIFRWPDTRDVLLRHCGSNGEGDDVDDVDIEIGGEMVCSDGDGWRDCDG